VQLWNRSLTDNLQYGNDGLIGDGAGLEAVLEAAELRGVIARLPSGAGTPLGEGGGLVSGGEGQRVRLGRALLRRDARLVILDEAFRGLERSRRRALYARTRALWPQATILCVTHDVAETLDFSRVLVIEGGRLVEDGSPARLREGPSRYRAMLESEEALRARVWTSPLFRSLEVVDGLVRDRRPAS
jgi:ABC-type transport system involved in cytochrome bd biosynthesis fused ATPase/permease subunit